MSLLTRAKLLPTLEHIRYHHPTLGLLQHFPTYNQIMLWQLSSERKCTWILDGQLGVAASQAYPICEHTDIGPDHRQASGEACNRAQEIAKQYGDTVRFYYEADKSPFYQYQREACKECSCAFCFLFPSEEEECLLRTNDNR